MSAAKFDPEFLQGKSIADVIDHWADAAPQQIFAIDSTTLETLDYQSLQESCRAIEARFVSDNVPAHAMVGYAMHNSLDAARVILGIFYSGRVATAINLVAGTNTLEHVLTHSQSTLVIYDSASLSLLEEINANLLTKAPALSVFDQTWLKTEEQRVHGKPAPNDDALLMYTSGTTGLPKGVVHTHASLLAGAGNTALAHQLSPRDRGLCVLPLYHINALCVSLLGALVSGGSVVMPPRFSTSGFWDLIEDHVCSWFSVVPTQISYLLSQTSAETRPDGPHPTLRFGRSASAPLSPEVQFAFEQRFGVPIIETMGLTETAAQILSNPLEGTRKSGSPGIAFGNDVKIVDETGRPLKAGRTGELWVRGQNVMRCYRNDEEATRAAITDDGWLKTGDLGRIDEDGYVFVTGRLKELIIKGGENIAPREIDEALYSHPDVIEAAAFARSCEQYGQRVEASVMLKPGSSIGEAELIALCQVRVGKFKCPDRIHILPELPKGPSGKIQRSRILEAIEA